MIYLWVLVFAIEEVGMEVVDRIHRAQEASWI
jgi:hypothetical protein